MLGEDTNASAFSQLVQSASGGVGDYDDHHGSKGPPTMSTERDNREKKLSHDGDVAQGASETGWMMKPEKK